MSFFQDIPVFLHIQKVSTVIGSVHWKEPGNNLLLIMSELRKRYKQTAESVFFYYYYIYYVAAKATYIRLLRGKIGFLVFFSALAPYKEVGPI